MVWALITVVHMPAVVVRLHKPRRIGRVGVERIQVGANIVDGPKVLEKELVLLSVGGGKEAVPARLLLPW